MKLFTTKIRAIDPRTGHLLTWHGPHVPGISFSDARNYCQENGLGYCDVDGILVAEIPETYEGSMQPDWGKAVDYDVEGN